MNDVTTPDAPPMSSGRVEVDDDFPLTNIVVDTPPGTGEVVLITPEGVIRKVYLFVVVWLRYANNKAKAFFKVRFPQSLRAVVIFFISLTLIHIKLSFVCIVCK